MKVCNTHFSQTELKVKDNILHLRKLMRGEKLLTISFMSRIMLIFKKNKIMVQEVHQII